MKYSRLFSIVLLVTLLTPFIFPTITNYSSVSTKSLDDSTGVRTSAFSDLISLPLAPRLVRVAIYNEPNTTVPDYATGPGPSLSNNYVNVSNLLVGAGYQVTALTMQDIQNHQLMTASFDVFVMVDNLPRENITNYVKEFWLGGGGIMTFSSSIIYLCYAGIIPPEAEGTDGSAYWGWVWSTDQNVTTRHPVTKSYQVNDSITEPNWSYGTFDWSLLMGSSVAGDLIKLGTVANQPNDATIVALDPTQRGGRAVQIPDEADPIATDMEALIIDAIDWLCPRPKGRILWDYAHQPYQGLDPWDTLSPFRPYYIEWRNTLVNRSYTFDKLYPSAAGNLTAANLDPYDMLITVLPTVDYTAAEVTAVTNWVSNGGGLLALGDNALPSLQPYNGYINNLTVNFDLSIENVHSSGSGPYSYLVTHPTTEGCSAFDPASGGYVNYTGAAYPIWGIDAANTLVAGQSYGTGRVILIADVNWCDDTGTHNIHEPDNYQYAINVANWLTAATADVLICCTDYISPNYYQTPVADALNDLGVSFHLTFNNFYLNYSLYQQPWTLVVLDQPVGMFDAYYPDLINYIDSGGHFIFSTFRVDDNPLHPIWARMGFAYANDMPDEVPLHIWDSSHDIFNQPNTYGASNFTPTWDYADEGDRVTVFTNATALAGQTTTPTSDEAVIVLRNDGHTLFNGYLIDEFWGDLDDSTYVDNLELWENEIAFMLRPRCTFTAHVPINVTTGSILAFGVDIENLGLRGAVGGNISVNVPAGLGTLITPAFHPFNIPPGGATGVVWEVTVTGTGNFTLSFNADYHGLPGTTYVIGPFTADVEALPGLPLPPLPWWWWIVLVVIVVIVVIIIIILFLRRRGSKST